MENYSEAVLCVSQQRNGRSEEDACRVSVLFQSDSDPPVSVKLHVLFFFSKSSFVQMIFNPFSSPWLSKLGTLKSHTCYY